ncbi:WXG100-like domain-containing protein [Nocardia thraciensis]
MTAPTVPLIVHRADEYHSAGEVFGQMSADAVTTHSSLVTVLTAYAGMAGSDSVGAQWAAGYDEAAQLAISTSSQLATSCGQIRDLIVVGAHNHQVAEAAADRRDLPPPPEPPLSVPLCLPEDAPAAAGDGIPEPFGWSFVKDAVGFGWPNGHQDQLNAAKTAWHTAAADYRTIAGQTPQAVELLANQQSPEIEIAVTTCQDRQGDLIALADACQILGDSCGEYATHLDEAHHRILDELKDLVVETVAAEAAFAVLIPFTGSLSEWVGNSALAGRIAMKTRRIATIIGELATKAAQIVTAAIKPLVERLKPLFERVRKWVDEAKTKLSKDGGGIKPAGFNWEKISGIVRDAKNGKGNFGVGSGTAQEAEVAGRSWVGPNAKLSSDGKTLVSEDGLRQFRPPSFKPNLGMYQSNFEWRNVPNGRWQGNGHMDVTDLP